MKFTDSPLYYLIKTARPRQWVKNLSLYTALFFSGFLYFNHYFFTVTLAFLIFTITTSSVYIFNDILDAPIDRLHPFKKKRPIASGKLPVSVASFASIAGLFISFFLAWNLNVFFFAMVFLYILLHFAYTLKLKQIPILDVLSIAAGFIIRVYAGGLVVNLHMSVWFLFTVVSIALFLAVGKRQSERTLLTGLTGDLKGHRATLSRYTERLLDIYTGMFANATWLSYALFTFNFAPVTPKGHLLSLYTVLPRTFTNAKLMMATVPLVIYGVMRYLQLVYEQNKGESPERVLLSDKPLITAVILYGLLTFAIIYGLS